MKILIIGLDGATWNVFDDYVLDHHMPNLKALKSGGYSGTLRSTEPPITPAAWTTFMTGCNPGTHGIIGFARYLPDEDRLQISTSQARLVPTIWQELSEQGYKVASINVPFTYPCTQVNGIMISGYGRPGPKSEFVYPPEFKDELLERIDDYDILAKWGGKGPYTIEDLDEDLKRVERSFEQKAEAAELVTEKLQWDVMMVQIHDTDLMEHLIWPYLDRRSRDSFTEQRDRVFETFARLDEMIGRLLSLAETNESCVVVVSDHGLVRRTRKVRPNSMLCDWGYLKPKGPIARRIQRRRRKRSIAIRDKQNYNTKGSAIKQPRDYDFQWSKSKAMVIDISVNGHLYVNVKGRQPNGTVEPGAEYDQILKDLTKRFAEVVDPETGDKVFAMVGTPADVYGVKGDGRGMCGDLVLVPRAGYELKLNASRRRASVQMEAEDSVKGVHSYEGIFLFHGRGIKAISGKHNEMVNMAPTIYAALGAQLPSYMDGSVMQDVFVDKKQVTFTQSKADPVRAPGKALSAEEEAEIGRRLRALGYVD